MANMLIRTSGVCKYKAAFTLRVCLFLGITLFYYIFPTETHSIADDKFAKGIIFYFSTHFISDKKFSTLFFRN